MGASNFRNSDYNLPTLGYVPLNWYELSKEEQEEEMDVVRGYYTPEEIEDMGGLEEVAKLNYEEAENYYEQSLAEDIEHYIQTEAEVKLFNVLKDRFLEMNPRGAGTNLIYQIVDEVNFILEPGYHTGFQILFVGYAELPENDPEYTGITLKQAKELTQLYKDTVVEIFADIKREFPLLDYYRTNARGSLPIR